MSDEEITDAERLEAVSQLFHAIEWLKQEGETGNLHAVTILETLVVIGVCEVHEDEPGNGKE